VGIGDSCLAFLIMPTWLHATLKQVFFPPLLHAFFLDPIGFHGPKSKNWHGVTVLDDTDVSGQKSGTSKEGKKTAWVSRAVWHGRATLARSCRATLERGFVLAVRVCFGVQYTWRLGFFSRGKTLDF